MRNFILYVKLIILLPYLAKQYIKDRKKLNQIKEFNNPVSKRDVGLVYRKTFVKKHLLKVLKTKY